jgi:DNA-binding transcriptional MerR regulator
MTLNNVQKSKERLPTIPDKRYFTIGETSYLCGVKPHVLRYWEQEFPRLRPTKRRGNRRYYQLNDLLMIRQIRKLLYDDGFTIEGARAQLTHHPAEVSKEVKKEVVLQKIITDLENMLQKLKMEDVVT